MLNELISAYYEKLKTYEDHVIQVESQTAEMEKNAEELEKKAAEIRARVKFERRMNNMAYPEWMDEVIVPLSEILEKYTGGEAEVYGPYGVGCRASIRLTITHGCPWQGERRLIIAPKMENGLLHLEYETGETTDFFAPDSIAAKSGMNNATAPLPGSIAEILSLFRPICQPPLYKHVKRKPSEAVPS